MSNIPRRQCSITDYYHKSTSRLSNEPEIETEVNSARKRRSRSIENKEMSDDSKKSRLDSELNQNLDELSNDSEISNEETEDHAISKKDKESNNSNDSSSWSFLDNSLPHDANKMTVRKDSTKRGGKEESDPGDSSETDEESNDSHGSRPLDYLGDSPTHNPNKDENDSDDLNPDNFGNNQRDTVYKDFKDLDATDDHDRDDKNRPHSDTDEERNDSYGSRTQSDLDKSQSHNAYKRTDPSELLSAPKSTQLESEAEDITYHDLFLTKNKTKGYTWDANHVKMPCDPLSKIVKFTNEGRKDGLTSRWDVIKEALKDPIKDVFKLKSAILQYNNHRSQSWDFKCLIHFFQKTMKPADKMDFFNSTLPEIINKALETEIYFPESIPLLMDDENNVITMTKDQAACLLANAFLCTFPSRSREKQSHERLPSINFNSLYNGAPKENRLEKLKCIIHYFERINCDPKRQDGHISFKRQALQEKEFPVWGSSNESFTPLCMSSSGTIEDDGDGMLQVDFANKCVGGGVLRHGCVQEEIRFMICPEMIVSLLFTKILNDNEVLFMTGCERFSKYKGYSKTFKWDGDFVDRLTRDSNERLYSEVVAMDAVVVRDNREQYSPEIVKRELNKAYCAFKSFNKYSDGFPAVCTGNWGCGAFGGDKELKGLLQIMAASEAKRGVYFFTFGDKKFAEDLQRIHSRLIKESYKVGDVMKTLASFYEERKWNHEPLLSYVQKTMF